LRLRHEGETVLSFSADGKQLISLGEDSALHAWSIPEGRKLRSFSPPGVKLTAARGKAAERVRLRALIQGGERVQAQALRQQLGTAGPAACSADGRWLACARPKSGVNIWDTTAGMEPQHLADALVVALAFSSDARLLALSELEGDAVVIRVWDRAAGRELWKLRPSAGAVPEPLRFSPDGKYLAAREEHVVRLWSLASGKRVRSYQSPADVLDFAFSRDGKHLAAVASNRLVTVWETASEEEAGTVSLTDNTFHAVCFAGNGASLFTWADDGLIRQWSYRQGLELRHWDGPTGPVPVLALTPDGKTLAAATADGVISLYDVTAGKEISPSRSPEVRALAFADPKALFQYTADGEARWTDWDQGKVRRRAARPSVKGTPYAVHARGKVQAWQDEDRLRLVEAHSGKTLATVGEVDRLSGMAFSPDGRLAAFGHIDESVRLWSLTSGKEWRRLEAGPAVQLAFSHDGKVLAVLGVDQEIHLWELATGERRRQLRATQVEVRVLEFTPDDRYLVAACADESVRVWDPLTGQAVYALVGHFGPVEALAVSPDSRWLASGGADGSVRVWDLGSGAQVRRLEGHRGPINALAFGPDGKRLASASKDATMLVWDLTTKPGNVAAGRGPAEQHWEDLGRADAAVAFRAMAELVRTPQEAVALFRARQRAEGLVTADRIAGLIADLSHARYAVRDKATKELARLEGQARRALLKALAAKLDGEAAKRLHHLVELLDAPLREPAQLRAQRAVEVLERIATPAALELLDQWARGAPGARLTESACEAGTRVRLRLKAP
jgi:WD40 repeat protein